jgi:hypothetical protein
MADIPAERRKLLENAHRQVEAAIASRKAVETQIELSKRLIAHSQHFLSNTRAGHGSLADVVSRNGGPEERPPRS